VSRPRVSPALYLAGAVALAAGCVVPVGPQFQDPIAAQNFRPQIIKADPTSGTWVQSDPMLDTATFTITVEDPNVGDKLYVRWAVEYPPRDAGNSVRVGGDVIIPPNGTEVRPLQSQTISCQLGLRIDQTLHSVWVGVSDQPFNQTAPEISQLQDNSPVAETRTWTLVMPCPVD
jgi:hypothetical protein